MALRLPEAFIEKESRMFGEAPPPICRTKVSCIIVPQDLGSREIIYGELNLYYF